jgi:hypothetical protein
MREVNFTHCRSCGYTYPETMLEDLECPDCRGEERKEKDAGAVRKTSTKGAARADARTENKKEARSLRTGHGYQLPLGL